MEFLYSVGLNKKTKKIELASHPMKMDVLQMA